MQRLHDAPPPYGVKKASDFLAFKNGRLIFVECKETITNTLNIKSSIRDNQIEMIYDNVTKYNGVEGGFMINFKTYKTIVWLPIQNLVNKIINKNLKSINFEKMLTKDNYYYKIINVQRKYKEFDNFEGGFKW